MTTGNCSPYMSDVAAARITRIAVVRALQLGDLLVAAPALRAMRMRFPDAEITLIGLPWAASFAQRFSRYIDRFVEFPGWPGIAEAPYNAGRTHAFLREQRAYRYDLVVQMHGSGEASNTFALALAGRMTVGYVKGASSAGLTRAAPYPNDAHEVARNLGLLRLLESPDHPTSYDTRLEFPLTATDEAAAEALLAPLADSGAPLIGIHAGARASARRWPAESFAIVADALSEQVGARIVLTGAADEAEIVATVARAMRATALNLAGKTSLGGLAALLTRLDLFIGNDTGPSHLAHAVDAPSVTIFGPADARRWAPLDTARHAVVRRPVPCSPCGYRDCPIDHPCLRLITPSMVLAAAQRQLERRTDRRTERRLEEPLDGHLVEGALT